LRYSLEDVEHGEHGGDHDCMKSKDESPLV